MKWFIVLLDAFGADDTAIEFDHEPTEAECNDNSEVVGYYSAGVVQAESHADAIRQANQNFNGEGCVA